MLDPTVQQIGVGGAVAVLLVATVMRFLPAFMSALKHQNGKFNDYQKLQIVELIRLANEQALSDMRKLIADRTELLREVIREEITKDRSTYVRSNNPDPYPGEERRRK